MVFQWPDEILLLIFAQLMPHDSTTSKHLARLCQTSMQFRRVAEPLLYCRIHIVSLPLVKALCLRPVLTNYIRFIYNHGAVVSNDDGRDPEGASATYQNHVRNYIKETYSTECLELYDDIFASLKDVEDNEGDSYFDLRLLLLLAVAKNLEVLDWRVSGAVCHPISRLFEFCGNKLATLYHKDLGEQQKVPLERLRSIKAPVETSTGDPWDISSVELKPLMYFPRLEEFRTSAVMVGAGRDEDHDPPDDLVHTTYKRPGWGSRPNMRHLHLDYTEIDPERGLEDLLRTFPNLHTLELHFGPHESRDPMDFSSWGPTLRKYGKKLRNFYFEPGYDDWEHLEDDDSGVIGSLREFPHLTQLRVPLVRLIGGAINDDDDEENEEEVLDLCHVLPKGLKYLWADKTEGGDQSVHDDRMEKLLQNAPVEFPDLEFVLTRWPEDEGWSPDEEYWEIEVVNQAVNKFVIYRRKQSLPDSDIGWREKGFRGGRPTGWETGPWK